MGVEALKQQFKEGKITKEQFLAEIKKLLDEKSITQEEHDDAAKFEVTADPEVLTAEQVQKMIADAVAKAEQSAADKVRTEYSEKLKAEQEEKERLLKEKMSDEEKAKFEKEKYERDLAEREAKIKEKEVSLHVIDVLTAEKLPLSFKEFIKAQSTEEADNLIKSLAGLWQAELKAATDSKFKELGDDPTKRAGGGTSTKKWSEMSLDEQGRFFKADPTKARELAKVEGIII